MGIFMERLKEGNYALNASPSVLFEILSSDEKKDKAISKVLEMLFDKRESAAAAVT